MPCVRKARKARSQVQKAVSSSITGGGFSKLFWSLENGWGRYCTSVFDATTEVLGRLGHSVFAEVVMEVLVGLVLVRGSFGWVGGDVLDGGRVVDVDVRKSSAC